MSCNIIQSLLDECKQNNEDASKCRWATTALNLCLNKTSVNSELDTIEKSLGQQPRTPEKKICCSCPDIKKIRDACIITNGEDNSECKNLVTAYRLCLRDLGFTREQVNL